MHFADNISILVTRNRLTLCDVRLGPTEDDIHLTLENGEYEIECRPFDKKYESDCIIIKKSRDYIVKSEREIGSLSVDGATIGVYEDALFSEKFLSNPEEFYYWGEGVFEASDDIKKYTDLIEPYSFICIPTFKDGVFEIFEQLDADKRVIGLRIQFDINISLECELDSSMFKVQLTNSYDVLTVWLDSQYDEEDIIDCIANSMDDQFDEGNLSGLYLSDNNHEFDRVSVEIFVATLKRIEICKVDKNDIELENKIIEVDGFDSKNNRFISLISSLLNDLDTR